METGVLLSGPLLKVGVLEGKFFENGRNKFLVSNRNHSTSQLMISIFDCRGWKGVAKSRTWTPWRDEDFVEAPPAYIWAQAEREDARRAFEVVHQPKSSTPLHIIEQPASATKYHPSRKKKNKCTENVATASTSTDLTKKHADAIEKLKAEHVLKEKAEKF